MAKRSRVPDGLNLGDAHFAFLDAIDKRQQQLAAVEDLDIAATTAEIIEKINELLASHRTR
jgi:hypothetical protein